jgi:hypothetical protein
MTILKPGLRWLIIGFLALVAIGVLAVAYGQEASPDEPGVGCSDAGEGSLPATPTTPTATPPGKGDLGEVTNLPDKAIDVVVISKPIKTPDSFVVNADRILRTAIPNTTPVTGVASLQQAITAIINDYNSHNPRRKLNVYLVGHGNPGLIVLGGDYLSNRFPATQENFIEQLKGKIEHLKFVSCSVADDQGFLDKLLLGLEAARVSGFNNSLWAFPPASSSYYTRPDTTPLKQYADTFRIQLPGNKVEKTPVPTSTPTATPTVTPTPTPTPRPVGGISVDPQLPGSSGSDAWLAEVIAGGMAVVVMTGGGVWYARRRRVQ